MQRDHSTQHQHPSTTTTTTTYVVSNNLLTVPPTPYGMTHYHATNPNTFYNHHHGNQNHHGYQTHHSHEFKPHS